jgi:hypothetical protein
LREYRIISEAEYNADSQHRKSLSVQFAAEIEANNRKGFGVIAVTSAPLSACIVTADHVQEVGLEELLAGDKQLVSPRLKFDWSPVKTTVEGAFVALMREQCGYVAGEAEVLRRLIEPLRRERKEYEVAPIWFSAEEVKGAGTRVIMRQDEAAQNDKGKVQIDKAHEKEMQAAKDAIERRLRAEHGVQATGLKDSIQKLVKSAADKPITGALRRATETEREFPAFSAWLSKQFDQQWETTDVNANIMDFGKVQWKDRSLVAIILRIDIKQDNRIRGEHQSKCFIFGIVDDLEFLIKRDPFDAECGSSQRAVADWKARRQFKTSWNAE